MKRSLEHGEEEHAAKAGDEAAGEKKRLIDEAAAPKEEGAADPEMELGEGMAVPAGTQLLFPCDVANLIFFCADWATRGTYLTTEFECFERDGLRFYHHVNGLFLLFLSKSHPLHEHPQRASLKLQYTDEAYRCLQVEGKKRKGAPRAEPGRPFASILLDDGSAFPLKCGIKGFIVEVNESLAKDASPILNPDDEHCYLAILQPKSDFKSLASFKPQIMDEAKERREKRAKAKEEKEQE